MEDVEDVEEMEEVDDLEEVEEMEEMEELGPPARPPARPSVHPSRTARRSWPARRWGFSFEIPEPNLDRYGPTPIDLLL